VIAAQLRQARAMLSLRAGALEEGEEELRRAHEDLSACCAPFLQARCELALGELLADSGREEEAEALLERSRQTFAALGANAWLARRAARVG
jgi:hypothetical protein